MSRTKFEILMNVEVEDAKDGTPISGEEVCDGMNILLKKANVVDIKSIHVSRTGRVMICGNCEQETSKLIKGLCIDCNESKNNWQEDKCCKCGGTYELSEDGGQVICANCK